MIDAPPPSPRAPWWRNPWIIAAISGVITITLIRPLTRRIPDPPPIEGEIQDFRMLDPNGRVVAKKDLAASVRVAALIALDCGECARVTGAMRRLQDLFERDGIDIQLISFVTDITKNNTFRWTRYIERFDTRPGRWLWLSVDPADVETWTKTSFFAHLSDPAAFARAPTGEWVALTRLIILDRENRIRGYFGYDAQGIDEVYYRAQHVLYETEVRKKNND